MGTLKVNASGKYRFTKVRRKQHQLV